MNTTRLENTTTYEAKYNIFSFSIRVVVLVLAIMLGTMFIVAGAKEAMAASLRPSATLTGTVLTLGDVFTDIRPERADYVLGPAPAPGHDLILNANTLLRVALALDLQWRPRSSADQITIRSAATIIDSKQIAASLVTKIHENGVEQNFDIIFGSTKPRIIMSQDLPQDFEIVSLDFNSQTDWFEAELAAPSAAKPVARITVSGKIERLIDIPVLKNTLQTGDIIHAPDLEWQQIHSRDLQHNYIMKADKLVGMSPRRLIRAGQAIRSNELVKPQLVGRGDSVTIVYEQGAITLTTKGRALRSGARGDVIRVVNMNSNRSIDGLVKDQGLVYVVR